MTNLIAAKIHEEEVGGGEYFAFGEGWARFVKNGLNFLDRNIPARIKRSRRIQIILRR